MGKSHGPTCLTVVVGVAVEGLPCGEGLMKSEGRETRQDIDGVHSSIVVGALCYESEGHGFETR
jgi:hypothetical protein